MLKTAAECAENVICFRNGEPNSETEDITGWLQVVTF